MTVHNLTSVIIVTYHTGPDLDRAIDSVLRQTADVELILINNGNPPEVEATLISRFKDEPLVRLMTGHGNVGLAAGLNMGVRVASGEHVLFLGHRCVLPADAIVRFYEQENIVKRPYMMGPRLVDETGRELSLSRRAMLTPQTAVVESLRLFALFPHLRLRLHQEPLPRKVARVPVLSSQCLFMVKADLIALHGFNPVYFFGLEDMDLCFRFQQKGGAVAFVPDIVVVRLGLTSAPFNAERETYMAKSLVRYFHENFGDTFFQPVLWGLYAFVWVRYALKSLRAGQLPQLMTRLKA